MHCALCRKKIGPVRRLFDKTYCSNDHRRRHRVNSARALRESTDFRFEFEEDEAWLPNPAVVKPHKQIGPTESGLLALMALGFLLLAALGMPGTGGGGGGAVNRDTLPTVVNAPQKTFGDAFRSALPSFRSTTIRDDFSKGLRDWAGAVSDGVSDWTSEAGFVRPGRLRLWQKSMNLSDYYLEFQAQIERKSVSWAYRALDDQNFYAAKITITQPGPLPRADLVRYVMSGGRAIERVELPLPLAVRNDTLYRVKMAVQGQQFHTVVNDQIVDTWSDPRYRKGGVGFFAEKGEMASIRWVRVSDHEGGFLDRLLSPAFVLGPLPR
jgi:hypothetical protein